MITDKDDMFAETKDRIRWMSFDGEPQPTGSRAPLSSPSFYERRSAPSLRSLLYHILLGAGVVCLALVFGGIFGIFVRSLTAMIP